MRKYHRTMHEAFPCGADYGCSVYAVKRNLVKTIASVAGWMAMFAAMLALMLAYFDVLVK